jgi:TolB protein
MQFVMSTKQAAGSCFLLAMLSTALPGQQAARRTDAGNGLYGAPISNLRDAYPAARTGGSYMHNYYLPPVSSTPWRPSFAPDGEWIAFSMAGSIWKIRRGEDTAYELTANPTYDSSPAWSPDGRWIAYTADDNYKSINLRLLNVTTGESTALTSGGQVNLDPVWSPDGSKILYASTNPDGWYNLYALPLDNGKPGAPLRLTEDNEYANTRLYFGRQDLHIEPTISPDGSEMILVSNRGISLGSGAIWRAPIAPNAMATAKQILREETLYRTQPQWSHDGKRILYSSHRGSQFDNLYVLPVEGGEPYQLTFGDWDHFEPRWSPDGEWIVYVANEHGLSDLRLLKTFGGEERPIEIRNRVYRRPTGTLHVIVTDAESGRPTEARISLRASDGKAYAPPDAYQRVAARALYLDFFHTSGEFTVELPAGEASIEAMKGFERLPVSKEVPIEAGGVVSILIPIERFTNYKAKGWYSGSDHVHMNYGGNLHNTPENLLFMAAGEDLDVVGEKIANKDNRIFDHQYYNGAYDKGRSTPERILAWGEEYRPPFYGHINLINLTEHLISPFTTGYEGTAIESLYPSNTDIFRMAHEQGALGGYVHPYARDPVAAGYAVARGFPVDLALGVLDYLEVMTSATNARFTSEVWHRALNCGFKITASGGEDSISNLQRTPVVGAARMYAYLGGKLEWSRWIDAIRKGRTFVTNGPLVQLEINGEIPGSEIHLPAEGGSIEIAARLDTAFPVEKLELISNGRVVEDIPVREGGRAGTLRKRIDVNTSGWYTLRATTEKPVLPIDDTHLHAETSPIYVYCGDKPIRSQQDAEYFIRWIDDITQQAREHPGWRSDRERDHVLGQFAEARKVFEQRAREAAQ